MASVRREAQVNASAAEAWAAVRDVGAVHERLAPRVYIQGMIEQGMRVMKQTLEK
jgi:hypothetical protein